MTVADILSCIRINAPEWYKREDFVAWLNEPGLATWHQKTYGVGEFSDVFMTYDHGDGSDREGIPEDIWAEIRKEMEARKISYCVLWLTNLEDENAGGFLA